eukprot:CAMPEP_0206593994 /NCGR_PEP_ID=MMETSP0325_2-20121206/42070_1 /ASSEMBLY_ACC=CAM_ASM_000347 /TAXON_ID=2866 /ORGANISM="Crypthecodinium cohnii, Strain Seligo" /LENGTH=115 /DNA_ID=CAMNT_0054104291 /DNA_START=132 /DNA_END=476 /DNA_ORIENTATION=+
MRHVLQTEHLLARCVPAHATDANGKPMAPGIWLKASLQYLQAPAPGGRQGCAAVGRGAGSSFRSASICSTSLRMTSPSTEPGSCWIKDSMDKQLERVPAKFDYHRSSSRMLTGAL